MTKLFLAAGVAALAIAAPAASQPGKGGDKGQAAKVERGGGKAQAAKVERGGGKTSFKAKGHDRKSKTVIGAKGADRAFKTAIKSKQNDRSGKSEIKARGRHGDRRIAKSDRKGRDVVRIRDLDDDGLELKFGKQSLAHWDEDGVWCPPGHAKTACMPPGQYKKSMLGRVIPAAYHDNLVPLALRDLYPDDDDYYYLLGNDGFLYRVDRDTDLIVSLLPLFGGGLMAGQMFPSTFSNHSVPQQLQAFYPDTQDDYYEFANGYVYEIDRDTGMIESMVPLMANGHGIGQMLPLSFSAYNVPHQYRALYPDGGDFMFRYAPGAIYQVDPKTRLITAVASLLTGNGLSVGQPLPMGFSTYNVPLAYRDQYPDTSDAWYRYSNGHIYQVDPTTQLVTALVEAIV